jgi:hypothetical protein
MTAPLYTLADNYADLFAKVEEANGELSPDLEAELDAAGDSLAAKTEACCSKVREWDLTATALQAEIDRLRARQQAVRNSARRLKAYIQDCLDRAGLPRVETPRFTATIQASPPSARWTGDPEDPPAAYRREVTEVWFNAKAALDDFKHGIELPEGVEVVRGKFLMIR